MSDQQRNAGLNLIVEQNVHRVKPRLVEFQLLDVQNEIARGEMHFIRQGDFHRDVNALHDRLAVRIDEVDFQLALALVAGRERQAQRDGALRMDGGHLAGINRVERAQQIELAVVIGGGVAQDSNLNVHAQIKTRISAIGTNFF